jgi:hypothetical protein
MLLIFSLTLIARDFFRADNMYQAFSYLHRMVTDFGQVPMNYAGVFDISRLSSY